MVRFTARIPQKGGMLCKMKTTHPFTTKLCSQAHKSNLFIQSCFWQSGEPHPINHDTITCYQWTGSSVKHFSQDLSQLTWQKPMRLMRSHIKYTVFVLFLIEYVWKGMSKLSNADWFYTAFQTSLESGSHYTDMFKNLPFRLDPPSLYSGNAFWILTLILCVESMLFNCNKHADRGTQGHLVVPGQGR